MFKAIIRAVNKVYAKERLDDVAYLLVHKGSFLYIFRSPRQLLSPTNTLQLYHIYTLYDGPDRKLFGPELLRLFLGPTGQTDDLLLLKISSGVSNCHATRCIS